MKQRPAGYLTVKQRNERRELKSALLKDYVIKPCVTYASGNGSLSFTAVKADGQSVPATRDEVINCFVRELAPNGYELATLWGREVGYTPHAIEHHKNHSVIDGVDYERDGDGNYFVVDDGVRFPVLHISTLASWRFFEKYQNDLVPIKINESEL